MQVKRKGEDRSPRPWPKNGVSPHLPLFLYKQEACYASGMTERFPEPVSPESLENKRKAEIIALGHELQASQEVFPFPGLEPESYAKLKASDEEYPGYTTPTDEILERLKTEGMKVVLGTNSESGNVFILPALSDDIENDMILPKHFQLSEQLNDKLRKLIEKSK